MSDGRGLRLGGYVSGGLLIFFGVAVIVLGRLGIRVHPRPHRARGNQLRADRRPGGCRARSRLGRGAGRYGRKALAQAEIMREHTLSNTGGLTYAEMGQYQSAEDPSDPVGTNDPEAAAQDENGEPISNSARNIWVTETALATALDMGFMSEMLSIFSIIVGIALLLTGIGLVILAKAVFGRGRTDAQAASSGPVPGAATA